MVSAARQNFEVKWKKKIPPLLIPDFSPMGDTKSKIIWSKQRLLRSVSTSARHHSISDGSFICWVYEMLCVCTFYPCHYHFRHEIELSCINYAAFCYSTHKYKIDYHKMMLHMNPRVLYINVCVEWYFMLKFNWSAEAPQTNLIEPFNLHNELKLSKKSQKKNTFHQNELNIFFIDKTL